MLKVILRLENGTFSKTSQLTYEQVIDTKFKLIVLVVNEST